MSPCLQSNIPAFTKQVGSTDLLLSPIVRFRFE